MLRISSKHKPELKNDKCMRASHPYRDSFAALTHPVEYHHAMQETLRAKSITILGTLRPRHLLPSITPPLKKAPQPPAKIKLPVRLIRPPVPPHGCVNKGVDNHVNKCTPPSSSPFSSAKASHKRKESPTATSPARAPDSASRVPSPRAPCHPSPTREANPASARPRLLYPFRSSRPTPPPCPPAPCLSPRAP